MLTECDSVLNVNARVRCVAVFVSLNARTLKRKTDNRCTGIQHSLYDYTPYFLPPLKYLNQQANASLCSLSSEC